MAIDYEIRNEKLQYDINRESAKISALLWGKIDKYEYSTGEEILPSSQIRVRKQAKCTYSSVQKALEKQIEKQVNALMFLNLDNKTNELKKMRVHWITWPPI